MISFVILHYQALEETVNCINSILENVPFDRHIYIVDNCSPNGSGEKLLHMFMNHPDISIILAEVNLGFAKGNNLGYQEAKKAGSDFIVVMNNDVFILQEDFTQRVLRAFSRTEFDILGPDIFSTRDNSHQNPQRIKNYTIDELKRYRRKALFKDRLPVLLKIKYIFPQRQKIRKAVGTYVETPMENVVLHGACYVYSKNYIHNHDNCFYGKTFMYFESYILHLLGNRERLKLVYEPDIKVIHHEDVATNQTYRTGYSRAKFSNKCLLDSCNCFIEVMKDENARIE